MNYIPKKANGNDPWHLRHRHVFVNLFIFHALIASTGRWNGCFHADRLLWIQFLDSRPADDRCKFQLHHRSSNEKTMHSIQPTPIHCITDFHSDFSFCRNPHLFTVCQHENFEPSKSQAIEKRGQRCRQHAFSCISCYLNDLFGLCNTLPLLPSTRQWKQTNFSVSENSFLSTATKKLWLAGVRASCKLKTNNVLTHTHTRYVNYFEMPRIDKHSIHARWRGDCHTRLNRCRSHFRHHIWNLCQVTRNWLFEFPVVVAHQPERVRIDANTTGDKYLNALRNAIGAHGLR